MATLMTYSRVSTETRVISRRIGVGRSSPGTQVAERRSRRFLYDVTEPAGQNTVLVFAWKQGRFDKQYVAARPGSLP